MAITDKEKTGKREGDRMEERGNKGGGGGERGAAEAEAEVGGKKKRVGDA